MTLFSSPNPLLEIMSILKTIFKQSPKQCGCQSINPLEDTYFMIIINGFCFNAGDLYPFLSLSLSLSLFLSKGTSPSLLDIIFLSFLFRIFL